MKKMIVLGMILMLGVLLCAGNIFAKEKNKKEARNEEKTKITSTNLKESEPSPNPIEEPKKSGIEELKERLNIQLIKTFDTEEGYWGYMEKELGRRKPGPKAEIKTDDQHREAEFISGGNVIQRRHAGQPRKHTEREKQKHAGNKNIALHKAHFKYGGNYIGAPLLLEGEYASKEESSVLTRAKLYNGKGEYLCEIDMDMPADYAFYVSPNEEYIVVYRLEDIRDQQDLEKLKMYLEFYSKTGSLIKRHTLKPDRQLKVVGFSEDGEYVAVRLGNDVLLYDRRGNEKWRKEGLGYITRINFSDDSRYVLLTAEEKTALVDENGRTIWEEGRRTAIGQIVTNKAGKDCFISWGNGVGILDFDTGKTADITGSLMKTFEESRGKALTKSWGGGETITGFTIVNKNYIRAEYTEVTWEVPPVQPKWEEIPEGVSYKDTPGKGRKETEKILLYHLENR